MKKHLANVITSVRILCSVWMAYVPLFSALFYSLYLLCGITDMLDGPIARRTNSVTNFGAKLDSAADLLFVAVAGIKILPAMNLSTQLWCWILAIASIRIGNILMGIVLKKQLVMEHTVLNKGTGLLLFLQPLTLPVIRLEYTACVICAVATVAALQESMVLWSK